MAGAQRTALTLSVSAVLRGERDSQHTTAASSTGMVTGSGSVALASTRVLPLVNTAGTGLASSWLMNFK